MTSFEARVSGAPLVYPRTNAPPEAWVWLGPGRGVAGARLIEPRGHIGASQWPINKRLVR